MPEPMRGTRVYLILLAVLCIGTTAMGTAVFERIIRREGTGIANVPLLAVFAVLYFWIAIGFWTGTFGFVRSLATRPGKPLPPELPLDRAWARTAIVMPIYNEDVIGVFSHVHAMYEEIARTGQGASFDFFILSDSTDPDVWLEEEQAWASLRTACPGHWGLYYRRRTNNAGRKSGNIADFCKRWGSHYRYMVVLDADSLMTAKTILTMVRRMEQDPQIGILQSPPMPVNRSSLFARLQQFAAHLYGPIFTSGYALWSQVEATYWGHNAILRVGPFMDCCGLAMLPGKPPWGGEILSHDFVEAALMRRRGWKVVVDHDLQGSYEECPANLIDFAKRDQRWCQGNLQHLRLAFSHGLRAVNRAQLGMGAMSYLSSLLWAVFLMLVVLAGLGMRRGGAAPAGSSLALGLFVGTMALLLLPKVWALLLSLLHPATIAGFGGSARTVLGVLLEIVSSVVTAPILMAFHSTFILAALRGHSVQWETQRHEDDRVALAEAVRAHSPHTIAGLAGALLVTWLSPGLLPWVTPVLGPLVFAIPLSMLLGSRRLGNWLLRKRLLVIPEELAPVRVIRRQRLFFRRQVARMSRTPHPFIRAILSPAFNALRVALVCENSEPLAAERMDRLKRIALSGGPAHLSKLERKQILSDPAALEWLHRQAWNEWPLDEVRSCGEYL